MKKPMITYRGYVATVRTNTTKTGRSVANVTLGWMPRRQDETGQWVDAREETTWFDATLWGEAADAAHQLSKGDEVVLTGVPNIATYQTKDGGYGVKIEVTDAAVALVETKTHREQSRAARSGTNNTGWGNQSQAPANGPQGSAQQAWGGAQNDYDSAPF
ncbi:single-stranded DNA-binding protein [Pseudoclavibacter alba]|uniref:single-stranded DNA-binding protein n=1 Tax=Pseudoclavibacter albus TaxID=272241 RepID=UPI0019D2C5D7|nr:single-stranded DNA-binding protein [Pseudoclavibacter alba]MBN6777412.1 single-stranded DNA-binding protein [Pseudoclavibacter alba]